MTVGLAREQSRFTVRHVRGQKNLIEQGAGLIGGPLEAGYALAALHADGRPADETTKALVMYLLRTHSWDGSWRIGLPHRPPLEDSDFAATALAIHGLQLYDHDDFRDVVGNRVKYATTWLAEAETRTLDDEVFRLMGLKWGGRARPPGRDLVQRADRADLTRRSLPCLRLERDRPGRGLGDAVSFAGTERACVLGRRGVAAVESRRRNALLPQSELRRRRGSRANRRRAHVGHSGGALSSEHPRGRFTVGRPWKRRGFPRHSTK